MNDLVGDSYYEWTFLAGTGDRYAGFLYHDTGAYAVPIRRGPPTGRG